MYDKKKKGMYKKLFHSIEKLSQLNSPHNQSFKTF